MDTALIEDIDCDLEDLGYICRKSPGTSPTHLHIYEPNNLELLIPCTMLVYMKL